jgi:glycosyltransferase involved in cell wall biosynthesis
MEDFKSSHANVSVIHHRRNYGQGRALRNGFDICRGNTIVTLDADLSYSPKNIYCLIDTLNETQVDIVLASPYMKGGAIKNVPLFRLLLSRVGNYYLSMATGQKIYTSTCVVRAYQRRVLDSLILTSDQMDLQLEILVKASLLGFHVFEIPAQLEWSPNKDSGKNVQRVSKINILATMSSHLLIGWLHRPAVVLMFLSWLLIIPGAYMAITIGIVTFELWMKNLGQGFSPSLAYTLKEIVFNHSQNIAFSAAFLGFGILIFAFSLILLQNKKYYDELSRMIQVSRIRWQEIDTKNDQT